ncbi:ABC transporter ATP-binding protein [Streptosporangium sp. CA-135522]|uniref:ABC transporter ATP-binding protein n=1 Tax=Streptosporangium sp. CA-135522 TaxID=3240072 RepID=UPI003D918368
MSVGAMLHRARTAAGLAWRAHPSASVGAVALAAGMGAVPVAAALLTKRVIDGLSRGDGADRLLPAALALGITALLAVTLPALSEYLQGQLRRALGLLIQDRLFRAVNAHPGLRHFENPEFHNRLKLAREAGQNAPERIVSSLLTVGQAVLTLAGFVATLIVLSPVLVAVVVLAALPSIRVQLHLSRHRAGMMWGISAGTRRQIFYADLLTRPDAAKEIRLFGLGDFLRERMLGELRTVNAAERELARRTLRSQWWLSLLGAVVAAAGLVWAIVSAASGTLTVGDVAVLVAATAGVQGALSSIVAQSADTHNALLMFGHYLDVVRAVPDLPTPAEPADLPALRDGIELRDVWFRYEEDHPWVLRGVDLFIPRGQSVALVGLNGAGKSTLVKLLCRLYDPERGAILWDGVDIRHVRPADMRERVGAVFQDYMSYDLTARENIRLGDLRADDPDLVTAAARRAGIHDKLSGLPKGYDTLLSRIFFGEQDESAGVVLSGGQWQRLALARAFMRDRRDLLILDEPSSGLDAEAEYAVHDGLRRHREGRTSLLISHRLGAIRDADTIVVLADGRIVERGSHAELMAGTGEAAGTGEYARLFALQARGYGPAESAGSDDGSGPAGMVAIGGPGTAGIAGTAEPGGPGMTGVAGPDDPGRDDSRRTTTPSMRSVGT